MSDAGVAQSYSLADVGCDAVPELTVLLPVYNGVPYLAEAMDSILTQSFTNFELLVIDDGSTDGSRKIIERFASCDARVRLVSRENRGLVATLNQGLGLSRADLIARMDADDIALPQRLERQVHFMKAHPEVDVCGTGLVIHETGEELHQPEKHDALHALALFSTPVYHPTVIMRKASVMKVGGYANTAIYAEDYDLWERMLRAGNRFANLKEAYLRYRMHPQVNREKYHLQQIATAMEICARQLARLDLPIDRRSLMLHRFCCGPCPETPVVHARLVNWLHRIGKANHMLALYPLEALDGELAHREQALSVLRPFQQPAHWALRQLWHCVHYFLSVTVGQKGCALEQWIASCWWEAKYFWGWFRRKKNR